MPSTDRKLELKAKTSVAQTASQAAVYAKGLMRTKPHTSGRHITHLTTNIMLHFRAEFPPIYRTDSPYDSFIGHLSLHLHVCSEYLL
jgi:hypothetical protein